MHGGYSSGRFCFFYTERGACVGEALRLKTKDVDLAKGTIKLVGCRGERENHTRRIALKKHSQWGGLSEMLAGIIQGIGNSLFVDKLSRPLNATYAQQAYHNLLDCRVSRADGLKIRPHLKIFDTRRVHTLTAWLTRDRRSQTNATRPSGLSWDGQTCVD